MKFTLISLLALNCKAFSLKTRIEIPCHLSCINHIQICNSVIPTFLYLKICSYLTMLTKHGPSMHFILGP